MAKKDLVLDEDYYIDKFGRWVFTEKYHLERGYCCSPHRDPGCLHCPYRIKDETKNLKIN